MHSLQGSVPRLSNKADACITELLSEYPKSESRGKAPSPIAGTWWEFHEYLLNLKVIMTIDVSWLEYHHRECVGSLFFSSRSLQDTLGEGERGERTVAEVAR